MYDFDLDKWNTLGLHGSRVCWAHGMCQMLLFIVCTNVKIKTITITQSIIYRYSVSVLAVVLTRLNLDELPQMQVTCLLSPTLTPLAPFKRNLKRQHAKVRINTFVFVVLNYKVQSIT